MLDKNMNHAVTAASAPTFTDRFSFKRAGMVAGFYYSMFRRQILLYLIVSVVAGVIAGLTDVNKFFTGIAMLMPSMTSFMVYWCPIVLAGRHHTVSIILPAKWSEKAFVLVAYFVVIVPAAVKSIVYVVSNLTSLAVSGEWLPLFTNKSYMELSYGENTMLLLVSGMTLIALAAVTLFMMVRTSRPKAWQGIVTSLGVNIAAGIIVSIFFFFSVKDKIMSVVSTADKPVSINEDVLVDEIKESLHDPAIISGALMVLVGIAAIYYTARAIKKVQD